MSSTLKEYEGGCHCGNIAYSFESKWDLEELPLRRCLCTFCTKQGARSASDPDGRLNFWFENESEVHRYRFGLRLAEFLVCGRCGVYVAAVQAYDDKPRAALNVNTLKEIGRLKKEPVPSDYDAETEQARTERRRKNWTPVVLNEDSPATD